MALIDKLKAIADGFRTSRNTTVKYTLDQMAELAAEPVGASIDTCTINVTFTIDAGNTLTSATTFANGVFSAFKSITKSGTFTIQNVVCGSALSIGTSTMCSLYWSGNQQ